MFFILFLLLFAKLTLVIFNLIHRPKEGVFLRIKQNKDFLFFILRRNLKAFVLNIYNYFPLPWAKILALRLFNIKIANNVGVLDSFIDSDFIEIGNNTLLGEGSIIMSSMILGDYFLLKRVILGDNVTIGAFSVIAPGTIVEAGAILGIGSHTNINQHLEENYVYYGRPARKIEKIE
jgi:acetyltransferase-like isoleucine patch superfamily enzyme